MSNERTTWTDVQRAANALADAARAAGYPCPPSVAAADIGTHSTLYVTPGSVSNGHVGEMSWTGPARGNFPIPGGPALCRSARDSYERVTQRTNMLLDLAARQRETARAEAAR